MHRTTRSRFRPTLTMLSAESRSAEPLHPAPGIEVDFGHATWDLGGWYGSEVELPADFVLREVLDPDIEFTDDGIAEFMTSWGLLVRPAHDWDDLPYEDWFLDPRFNPDRLAESDYTVPASIEESRRPHVSMKACAMHLRILRALSLHYAAFKRGDDDGIRSAWSGVQLPYHVAFFDRAKDTVPSSSGFPTYDGPIETLWRRWVLYVNAALRAFPPRVGLLVDDAASRAFASRVGHVIDGKRTHELGGDLIDIGDGYGIPSTYELAVLQLAQTATADWPVRQCANETCRNLFTRQRSERRKYNGTEHAEGVKYCSGQCARQQAERERRRRIRDAKRARREGSTS